MPFNWQTVSAVFQQELDALYMVGGLFFFYEGSSTASIQLVPTLWLACNAFTCLSSTILTLDHPTDDSTEA